MDFGFTFVAVQKGFGMGTCLCSGFGWQFRPCLCCGFWVAGSVSVLIFSSKTTVELSFVVCVIVRALMMVHGTIYQFGMGFIHGGGK